MCILSSTDVLYKASRAKKERNKTNTGKQKAKQGNSYHLENITNSVNAIMPTNMLQKRLYTYLFLLNTINVSPVEKVSLQNTIKRSFFYSKYDSIPTNNMSN